MARAGRAGAGKRLARGKAHRHLLQVRLRQPALMDGERKPARSWLGFVAIASRYGEKLLQIQEATKGRRLFFPIVLDESGETARQWFAQQTPRCYMVTADARLAYRGAIDNFKSPTDKDYVAYLEPAIASFLAGESIARPETASFGCSVETTYYHLPRQL